MTELDYRTPEVPADTGADEYPTLSNPNQIRAVVERVKVFVPQWKCHVWVHELTGEELDLYRQPMYQVKETKLTLSLTENTLRLLAYALRTEQGDRLWPNTKRGVAELGKLPSGGSELLAKTARRLSGLSDDDEEAKAGKVSSTDPTDDSFSD